MKSIDIQLSENYPEPKIVAEIGCNHNGSVATAKELIEMAAMFCKADYVKFQKRNPKELLTEQQYNSPHPNPVHSYGETYGEHREFLEFDLEIHKELKSYCESRKIRYSCSVWDLTSAKEIASLNPDYIKIPSASNTNFEMLSYLCEEFKGEIHISFGMTTLEEKEEIIRFFRNKNRMSSLVIYHTTSGYPVPFEDLMLLEVPILKQKYSSEVKGIGFSGHHLGIYVDVMAYTLGSQWIERHFTLDRTWKGSDHAASLEPDGLRRVARDLRNARKVLQFKPKEILDIEVPQRAKLKWRKD